MHKREEIANKITCFKECVPGKEMIYFYLSICASYLQNDAMREKVMGPQEMSKVLLHPKHCMCPADSEPYKTTVKRNTLLIQNPVLTVKLTCHILRCF